MRRTEMFSAMFRDAEETSHVHHQHPLDIRTREVLNLSWNLDRCTMNDDIDPFLTLYDIRESIIDLTIIRHVDLPERIIGKKCRFFANVHHMNTRTL